ncbi:hypothetical protein FVO59_03950 [Microbacterium esteraromaticum]|uniref:Integral membrane protein n=1 Tax=Microbacterium esteraromaticum TaxID=57043 RepID=A0A7D7W7Q3_9MICO|nr:hypothetical protein [Microbacterium esteraromaticum]QMU96455.1 hypothetical protein FVO59_03950 [Microbacterium esteraromaticum]
MTDGTMTARTVLTPRVAAAGLVVVTAYAALAALQIFVLNPLAAVPGASLSAVYAEMDAVGETMPVAMPAVVLGIGVVAAVVVAVLSIRSRLEPAHSALLFLLLLVFGTPGYFVASFGPGMNLADTFMISGADYSRWSLVLYAVSMAAVVAVVVLVTRLALRRPAVVKG